MTNNIVFGRCSSGFFSNCNIILTSIIFFFNNNQKLPLILIDTHKMFDIYKINEQQNIYKLCFYEETNANINYEQPITFSKTKFENQFSDYKLFNFKYIIPFISKYFNPTEFITDKISYLKTNYNIDDNYYGIFYRGNDKILETQKPPYEEIIQKALYIKNNNNNIKFIVQTDELEFLQYFLNIFPTSIYFKEIPIIKNSMTTVALTYINRNNKNDVLGFYVASIYIFSKLKTIITTSGNGEMFMIFLRGNADNVYQFLKKNEYIYGVKNVDFDQNETQVWY